MTGTIEQYEKMSARATQMAADQDRVIYLEETKYGWHITLDATHAAVAISPSGDRQYLS